MKIEISELGYVKDLTLDLSKNLTVLCGPNGTGKTYVAYAIYGLMKFRSEIPRIKRLTDGLKDILLTGQADFDIVDLLTHGRSNLLTQVADAYVKQIYRVFASDEALFKKTSMSIDLGSTEELRSSLLARRIRTSITIRNYTISIKKEEGSSVLNCLVIIKDDKEYIGRVDIPESVLLNFISDRILNIILDFVFPKVYIAPAERIAINIFSKELSLKRNILVDKLLDLKNAGDDDDPFDMINRRASRYPSPVRDSLEVSEDLNNFKKNISDYKYFADEIEKEILKGQVIISKDGDVQFKPDKAKSLRLPIHLTASVVKSLSNLVIYFKHLAKEHDFIIIDEPELNLHPDNQVVMARIIAKIVNKGFKVLISTHSDYIIRELNNLIMLKDKPSFQKKYPISEDCFLSSKDIGAILFHYNNKKCSNLEVNETGFEVETIDDVINELNGRAQDLFFNIVPE